jgi:hypothetical protein
MHLASDYIHSYKDAGGSAARCRVRIYLPDNVRDTPVVICSELPNNPGGSITNSVEAIAAGVIQANELSTPLGGSSPGPRRALTPGRRPSAWLSSLATRWKRGHPSSGRRGHG